MHLMPKKMPKKGQMAIFLIIGILIIIAGAFYFYTTTFTTESRIERKLAETQEVPADFNPVKEFVDKCIYSTALKGLEAIGANGGYTSIDPSKIRSEKFSPASSDRVAYWFYADSSTPFVQKPKLKESDQGSGISMEKQLEDFVKSDLNSCLENFNEFKKQGFSINEGKLATQALIRDSDVLISANYPLKIEKGESQVNIEDFFVTIPFNIRAIYELASAVADYQSIHRYLEKYTNTLIFIYSGPESDKLPVTSELRFDFTPSFWIEHEVEKDLKDILNTNIQQLRVLGSRNYVPYGDDDLIAQGIYDGLETLPLHTGAASFAPYNMEFEYLPDFFPFKFNVCNGAVCRSESRIGPIPLVGFQRSSFSYDVEYPVLVKIKDPSAIIFGNQGYTFNLFLQSKILNNNPHMEQAPPRTIIPTALTFHDTANQPQRLLFEGPTICSPDVWDSEEILIKPVNASDLSRKIPNAQIYFTAAEVSCSIGSTNPEGFLVTRLPTGTIGGAITATAEGFIDKSIMYDPGLSPEKEVEIKLEPIVAKKFVVYKKKFKKADDFGTTYWNFEDASLQLSPKENAIITLERNPAEGEPEFFIFGEFNGRQYDNPPQMNIAPGNYNLSINLILNDLVIIPKSEIEFWKPKWTNPLNHEKVEIPEINFGEAPQVRLHIARLAGLSAGDYEYKVKCITPPPKNPDGTLNLDGYEPRLVDYGSVRFKVEGNAAAAGPLQIISKTPLFSTSPYLIVETNKDSQCRYFETIPSYSGIEIINDEEIDSLGLQKLGISNLDMLKQTIIEVYENVERASQSPNKFLVRFDDTQPAKKIIYLYDGDKMARLGEVDTSGNFIRESGLPKPQWIVSDFRNFDISGKIHTNPIKIIEGTSMKSFYIACFDGNKWLKSEKIDVRIQPKPEASPQDALRLIPMTEGFSFSSDEAIIAFESNKETSCRYANNAEVSAISDESKKIGKYKPFSGVTDANFPEGGLDMDDVVFTAEELYRPGKLEFIAIDLGIDDVGTEIGDTATKEIDDLDQMDKIEEYSDNYRGNLLPMVR